MHILLNRGAMFDIATRIPRSMSIFIAILEYCCRRKPASHKYDVAKGTRTRRALQPTSGNSDRALTQNEISKLRLYKLFKVRSEERSINCSASRDVNLERHFDYQQKDFLSNCASPCLQKNISQNARLEHSNANTSQSSFHTHRYSAERLPDCEFKWDFKSGKLSHCLLFISRSICHNCSFLLKAVILS